MLRLLHRSVSSKYPRTVIDMTRYLVLVNNKTYIPYLELVTNNSNRIYFAPNLPTDSV